MRKKHVGSKSLKRNKDAGWKSTRDLFESLKSSKALPSSR
jgi:hypothetical protein